MDMSWISDAVILVSGAASIWMVNQRGKIKKWASIVGLIAQPFWFYTSFTHHQWGIFILVFFYTFSWLQGFYNSWIRKQ